MAEFFKCYPLPLLDGLRDLSDDAALVYAKALLLIYHRNGRIPADALRSQFPRWRPHRLHRAVTELLQAAKLVGTITGQLHNERAMHELAQLEEQTRRYSDSGRKGGQAKAKRERLAKAISERNRSPDLFPERNAVENDFTDEKPNKNNDSDLATPRHTRAPAREETALNSGSTAALPPLNERSTGIENAQRDPKPNDFNGGGLAKPWHARPSELEPDLEEYSPVSPHDENGDNQAELVEGEVEDDFAIPKRKPGRPIPPDWKPDRTQLSDAVQQMLEQWPDGEFEREATKFVEDAHSNDRRHRQWNRALGVWLMKHDGYLHERNRQYERPSGWRQRA